MPTKIFTTVLVAVALGACVVDPRSSDLPVVDVDDFEPEPVDVDWLKVRERRCRALIVELTTPTYESGPSVGPVIVPVHPGWFIVHSTWTLTDNPHFAIVDQPARYRGKDGALEMYISSSVILCEFRVAVPEVPQ